MKKEIILCVCTCFTLVYCGFINPFSPIKPRLNSKAQTEAVISVLERVLKSGIGLIKLKIGANPAFQFDGFNVFKSQDEEYVHVTAPNAVSALWGINYYLKYYCNSHISWDGDQFHGIWHNGFSPVNITILSTDIYRFYQNPCASSYSYVWWNWKRWEREIDWMALNGINLALAFTAQEAIWQRVYDGFELSDNDFSGTTVLAWNRMGNIKKLYQGFPEDWHYHQVKLQHKILKRMRELGITPVLPGFCGIIPDSFREIFPTLQVTKLPKWNNFPEEFCCPNFLNPNDPVYNVIGQAYFREYIKEFGTDHIYSCDMFNENAPPVNQKDYLTSVSQGIFRTMSLADPLAVWMIQGWMFREPFWANTELVQAFLKGVPIGKLLILDLQADLNPQYLKYFNYFGHAFIWCLLHNFGGQLGLYGHLDTINKELSKVKALQLPLMVGIGIVPEGIDQNYIIYEFTLDGSLRSLPANVSDWVSQYSLRRYGIYGKNAVRGRRYLQQAWQILRETAYNYTSSAVFSETPTGIQKAEDLNRGHMSKNIMTKLPSLKLNELTWYNKSKIYDVYKKFLKASQFNEVSSNEIFQHDFIDVTRQTIQFAFSSLYFSMINKYSETDKEDFQNPASLLLSILDELNTILASGKKFIFGKWLRDSFYWSSRSKNCSYDARIQVTLWGPNGELRDYAAKQWAGLVVDYYKPRWAVFIKALNDSLFEKASFNEDSVKDKIFRTVEKPFVESNRGYEYSAIGNPVKVIKKFDAKWGPILYEIFKNRTFDEDLVRLINSPSTF